MTLFFGEHDDVVFTKPPLKTVVVQINFPTILSLLNQAGMTGFRSILSDDYPEGIKENIGYVFPSPPPNQVANQPPIWSMQNEAKIWTVNLSANFLSLETSEYTGIDDFLIRFRKVLDAAHRTLRLAPSTRIGFRKINFFDPPNKSDLSDFRSILKKPALGMLGISDFPAKIVKGFSQTVFADSDNSFQITAGLAINHLTSTQGYIFDMDYSTEKRFDIDDGELLLARLRNFSDGMTNYFHWATLDEYKDTLQPKPRSR